MRARLLELRHWKTDHDRETCQDASAASLEKGLFAIADGVSNLSHSGLWARTLTQQFAVVPLLCPDPFEVDWWMDQARGAFGAEEQFEIMALPASDRWKVLKGSASTFLGVRFHLVDTEEAVAECLAIGDSCAFFFTAGGASAERLASWPFREVAEMPITPSCLPSKEIEFDRALHRVTTTEVRFRDCDTLLLTPDTVAKWIMGQGSDESDHRVAAVRRIIAQTSESWAGFIEGLRRRGEMH